MKGIPWVAAILAAIAFARAADAQCPHCGGYHGGAPSSDTFSSGAKAQEEKAQSLLQEYQKRETERQAAVKQQFEDFQKQDAAQREESTRRQAEQIQKIQAAMKTDPAKVPDPAATDLRKTLGDTKREQIRQEKAAEAQKAAEKAKQEGRALTPEEKQKIDKDVGTATGREASRERMKLAERNRALDELKAKEKNDRPGPGELKGLPERSIFEDVVTQWEKTKQRMGAIFDNSGTYDDPTK